MEFWRGVVPEEATAAETAYCIDTLGVRPGARVLDVACGDGRHSLALAAAGLRPTGVDIAAHALGWAREEAAARGLDATFLESDVRDPPAGPFDGAVWMGNGFGYLDHEGNLDSLRAVAAALRPGARLVIDLATIAESLFPVRDVDIENAGVRMTSENAYDAMQGRLVMSMTFRRGDEEERGVVSQSVHTAADLARLAQQAGLGTVAMHADPDGTPFSASSRRLLLVTEKG